MACGSSYRTSPSADGGAPFPLSEPMPSAAPRTSGLISFGCATKRPIFREEDPLLITKRGTPLICDLSRSRRPLPVADLGHIFAVLADVGFVALPDLVETLGGGVDPRTELGDAADDVENQLEAIHAVEYDHVKGGGGGAFLDVAGDGGVVGTGRAIGGGSD